MEEIELGDENADEKEGKTPLAPARGTRDFLPEEKILRDKVVDLLRSTFERYGFNPLETPAMEKWDVLASKYAGGAEILKETYSFEDQGGRKLGLRYDLTVPLCRVVASNPSLPMPFKRYAIAPVWRDGPLKLGRYREFVQCDVDTIGVKSGLADAEIIALTCDAFDSLGFDYTVKVNNRKLLEGILETSGVPVAKFGGVMLTLDKLQKIGSEGVEKELLEVRELPIPIVRGLLSLLDDLADKPPEEILKECEKIVGKNKLGAQGLTELEEVFDFLDSFGIGNNVVVDVSLARGLAYYTGTIFEAYLNGSEITSSIAAGGRYDELIAKFAGREGEISAVGISFGLDVICEAIKKGISSALVNPGQKSIADVFVIPIKTIPQSLAVTQKLRAAGVKTAFDLVGRNISKNLDYAGKQGIKFAAIVGTKEADKNKLTLRNLETGEEKLLTLEEAVEEIQRK